MCRPRTPASCGAAWPLGRSAGHLRVPHRRPRRDRAVLSPVRSWLEAVADPPHGGDEARPGGIFFDLLAHPAHVHGDGAGVDVLGGAPDELEQPLAVEDL